MELFMRRQLTNPSWRLRCLLDELYWELKMFLLQWLHESMTSIWLLCKFVMRVKCLYCVSELGWGQVFVWTGQQHHKHRHGNMLLSPLWPLQSKCGNVDSGLWNLFISEKTEGPMMSSRFSELLGSSGTASGTSTSTGTSSRTRGQAIKPSSVICRRPR